MICSGVLHITDSIQMRRTPSSFGLQFQQHFECEKACSPNAVLFIYLRVYIYIYISLEKHIFLSWCTRDSNTFRTMTISRTPPPTARRQKRTLEHTACTGASFGNHEVGIHEHWATRQKKHLPCMIRLRLVGAPFWGTYMRGSF